MRTIFIVVGFIFLICALFILIGLFLPKQRKVSKTEVLSAPIEKVWATVTDVSVSSLEWRTSLQDIKIISSDEEKLAWEEYPKKGQKIIFYTKEKIPFTFYKLQISGTGFEGEWVGLFKKINESETEIQFTEIAIIDNPLFRVLSAIFFNLESSMDTYVAEIKKGVTEK